MVRAEFRNGFSFGGLMLAGLAGIVAFLALMLVGDFDFAPALACAVVITAIVAVIAALPAAELSGPVTPGVIARPKPAVPVAASAAVLPAAHPVAPEAAAPMDAVQAPTRLDAPRGGMADNLQEIEGIGPAMEKLCHDLGFYHFDQIAAWTPAEVAWVDQNLTGFKGRVTRDRWVVQAQMIQSQGIEAFRVAARTNAY